MGKLISNASVFVVGVSRQGGMAVVEAANGSESGPPFVRFQLQPAYLERCHIGKRYNITIEDPDL